MDNKFEKSEFRALTAYLSMHHNEIVPRKDGYDEFTGEHKKV